MIWATVRSQSYLCWLYRASPSLDAKNIINLILVLTIWWCPCVESSLVLLEEGVFYDQGCFLLAKLLAFALLHFALQCQTYPFLQESLDFLFFHFSPLWWKGHLFWLLVLKGLVGLHRTVQFRLPWHQWLGLDFYYCDIKWYSLEMNQDHSGVFEIAPKNYILKSSIHYKFYSISSKGFLLAVVDMWPILVKFSHSHPF